VKREKMNKNIFVPPQIDVKISKGGTLAYTGHKLSQAVGFADRTRQTRKTRVIQNVYGQTPTSNETVTSTTSSLFAALGDNPHIKMPLRGATGQRYVAQLDHYYPRVRVGRKRAVRRDRLVDSGGRSRVEPGDKNILHAGIDRGGLLFPASNGRKI